MKILLIFAVSLLLLLLLRSNTECKEVCHNEFFTAKCPEGHVVLMTSSLYGRMRSGRCVKTSFGYTGCYADVLEHTHERCSGRHYCQIKVPDASMDSANPCNNDLISYLDANFTCIKDTKTNDSNCQVDLVGDEAGYIVISDDVTTSTTASGISSFSGGSSGSGSVRTAPQTCGLKYRPWIIRAKKGQRINLTLYDFSPYLALATAASAVGERRNDIVSGGFQLLQNLCSRTIVYRDSNGTQQVSPCRAGRFAIPSVARRRQMHLHLTSLNEVQIHSILADQAPPVKYDLDFSLPAQEFYTNLVVKYQATGCPDVEGAEAGRWMKREDDRLLMGCSDGDERWETVCDGVSWRGVDDFNCSGGIVTRPSKTKTLSSNTFLPLGASIFVVVIMSITVGLMVLIMGICFMRRRRFCSVVDQTKDERMIREMKLITNADPFKRPACYSSTAESDICDSTSYDNDTNSNIDCINKSALAAGHSQARNVQPSCMNLLPVKAMPCKMARSLKATVADCSEDGARNREALLHYEYVWQANSSDQPHQQPPPPPQQQQQLLQASSSKAIDPGKADPEQEPCCRLRPEPMHHHLLHHHHHPHPHHIRPPIPHLHDHHHHHHHLFDNHHHHQQQQQQLQQQQLHRYHHRMQVPTVVFLQTSSDSRPDLLRLTSTARTNTFYSARDATESYRSFVPGTLQVNLTTSFEGRRAQPCKSLEAPTGAEDPAKSSLGEISASVAHPQQPSEQNVRESGEEQTVDGQREEQSEDEPCS